MKPVAVEMFWKFIVETIKVPADNALILNEEIFNTPVEILFVINVETKKLLAVIKLVVNDDANSAPDEIIFVFNVENKQVLAWIKLALIVDAFNIAVFIWIDEVKIVCKKGILTKPTPPPTTKEFIFNDEIKAFPEDKKLVFKDDTFPVRLLNVFVVIDDAFTIKVDKVPGKRTTFENPSLSCVGWITCVNVERKCPSA